ncbi:MAG: flavin reductase family protein [Sphingobacteriales bacterium]|jgi:flavin reductase (DIM6/NTAB) family NADH-FMN oxidoreductase RutF|nr:flavin reductase family protein [Sphingobacteriales bacterium]
MKTIIPKETGLKEISNFFTSAIIPRPIAFVSTVDENGTPNLSPFSFFNVFSSDPPVLVFSPAKSALTGKQKDTYYNIKAVPECVIHIANYAMAEQLSVTSGAYPAGVNEFIKGGFAEEQSTLVKPPRIKEAPIAFECKVNQVVELGDKGGSGNLMICEILMIHVDENILDEKGNVIAEKLDPIARLGYNNYVRFTKEAIFETPKPLKSYGVGVDAIPQWIKDERVLDGNELGKLASIAEIPNKEDIKQDAELAELITEYKDQSINELKRLLSENKIKEAWWVLLNLE